MLAEVCYGAGWLYKAPVRSHGAQSTVEVEDAVVCILVGGEKDGGMGDFRGLAKAPQWDLLQEFIFRDTFCMAAAMCNVKLAWGAMYEMQNWLGRGNFNLKTGGGGRRDECRGQFCGGLKQAMWE